MHLQGVSFSGDICLGDDLALLFLGIFLRYLDLTTSEKEPLILSIQYFTCKEL